MPKRNAKRTKGQAHLTNTRGTRRFFPVIGNPASPASLVSLAVFILITGSSFPCFGQLRVIARCIEYPIPASGEAVHAIAHFDYVNFYSYQVFIPTNSSQNFTSPVQSSPPDFFSPGYHPDALRVSFPLSSGSLTWFAAQDQASANPSGGTAPETAACPVTFVVPPALTFTQPGTYSHQYLGQIDAGPAADPDAAYTVTALASGTRVLVSNLSYVPGDATNPSNSFNPNSIYGDVTVLYGPAANTNVRLQLSRNGKAITRGIVSFAYNGPQNAPAPPISFTVPNHTFGDAPFTVAASSASSGDFTYSVLSGPATQAGSTVTLTGAGIVTLQASQAAVPYAYAAGSQQTSFTVAKAAATVSLGGLSQPYTGFPLSAAVSTSPSGLAVSTTYNGFTTLPTAAGTYAVAATINDTNYQGSANGTLTVTGPISGTVVLSTRMQVSVPPSGGYLAVVTVTNSGTGTSQATQLQTASLGSANASVLPVSLGNIAPNGGTVTLSLNFPSSAGTPGSTVLQKLSIKYAGGTSTTSGRVVLPASAP